jgi:hypothetical protein
MTDDPKRLAQELLSKGVRDAAECVISSIKGTLHIPRGSTRTTDARWLLTMVMEMEHHADKPEQEAKPIKSVGQLAELSEHIRLLKQNERRGA